MLLLKNATIVHLSPPEVIEHVDVLVEGSEISRVGTGLSVVRSADTVLDVGGLVVMPGLVCSHNHFYSGLARGILAAIPPITDFISNLSGLWWRLDRAIDEEILYHSGMVCCIEAIRAGCTAVIDHHASPSFIDGSLNVLKRCFERVGLRGVVCYETSDRNGEDEMFLGIRENIRFARTIDTENALKGDTGLVEGMIGGHAPFTLPDRGLEALGNAAEKTGRGFHVHVAEDRFDQSYTHRYYQKDIIQRLDQFGLVTEKSVFAHGIYLNQPDIDTLNNRGAALVHNCRSNMNNSVGYHARLQDINTVGIGTDGIGSDVLEELKIAYFKNRDIGGTLSPDDYLGFLQNGNGILERAFGGDRKTENAPRFGRIEPGYQADITILDYRPPTPLVAENVGGHVIFGMSSRDVNTVIVNGNVVMENRRFSWDVDAAFAEAQPAARRLWSTMDRLGR